MLKRAAVAGGLLLLLAAVAPAIHAQGDPKRGLYLSQAGGCIGCHTDSAAGAQPYAGGRALKTPFGTFYGPNITPDPQAGIGRWTEADFIRALREGVRPDGAHYFPAFPYPSFTKISDSDLRDLWTYLRTVSPSARANQAHDLRFPFGFRFLVPGWKLLFFQPGPYVADSAQSEVVNRGAYLAQALGHCGECHTPRNFLGGPRKDRYLAGAKLAEGAAAPNLTPTRLKKQSDKELAELLQTAMTADGDELAESMAEVVRNTTSKLTAPDLVALIAYLRALAPLPDEAK